MLAILYMLALRRSELVEIDYFEERGDVLAEGLELELLRSKGDQEKPVKVAVARSCNPPRIRRPGALDRPR